MSYRILCFLIVVGYTGVLRPAVLPAQTLISTTLLGTRTQAQLVAEFGVPFIQYGVKYYRITYTTPDIQGVLDTASGLVAVPDNPAKVYPRLVYQHGTSGSQFDVPSYNVTAGGEGRIAWLFGGMGYLALAPDYLGFGTARGFHPYVHAASEAWVALDMLRAMEQFENQQNVSTNDQLFVTGYSQGGHAAMALQRAIETDATNEFEVTASAPMSGPYSISGVMRDLILSDDVYYYPAYLPNTALSYQEAYGNIYSQLTDLFKPAYAVKIQQYRDGTIDLGALNSALIDLLIANEGASIARGMLQPAIIQAIENDPGHPVNVALADNDVYDFTANAPTRLFYCMADDQVPFLNSPLARDSMIARGAANLQAIDVNSTADHGACVTPALTNTLLFFAGFQQIGTVNATSPAGSDHIALSPNPARGPVLLRNLPAAGELTLSNLQGQVVLRAQLEAGDQSIDVSALKNGAYAVKFQAGNHVWKRKLVVQR